MASTYSNLKIELIGTGDQSGTWGVTTNTNLGTAIEEAITGSADVTFTGTDVTLTLTNTNSTQTARNLRLRLTGTSSGTLNLTVPDIEKFYIIANELANDVTVKNTTGTTYTVPAGTTAQVFSTGTGIESGISFYAGAILSSAAVILGGEIDATPIGAISPSTGAFTSLEATSISGLLTPLSADQGGTGQSTYTVGDLLIANSSSSLSKLSDVATGNALISGGIGAAPSWGKIDLTAAVSNTLPVTNGGTGASTASITSFNNITGYTASGATGTTSSNLVFSASPTLTGTPLAPTAAPGTNTTQIATTAFVQNVAGGLGTMSTQNANAVAITGGTITGTTVNTVTVGSNASGTKTISTSAPTGGSDGDVWYRYT